MRGTWRNIVDEYIKESRGEMSTLWNAKYNVKNWKGEIIMDFYDLGTIRKIWF